MKNNAQRGVTLVELVIAIVILGVAVSGIFFGVTSLSSRSADPMLRSQALAIAQSYLEEIRARAFLDPDTGLVCDASTPAANTRPDYDNVCDYQGIVLDNTVRDQFYQTINELSAYQVQVTITPNSGNELNGITAADAIRIDVQVTDPNSQSVILTGYRGNF